MLAKAIKAEVNSQLREMEDRVDEKGRRQVVLNGYLPERTILTGVGEVPVRVPKIRALDGGEAVFRSVLVPRYVRRSPMLDNALPYLYLAGVAQRDITKVLAALVGQERVDGASPSVISSLKADWTVQYEAWRKRDLNGDNYVYIWADGIHCTTRCDGGGHLCLLVVIGVTKEGHKHFLAIEEGNSESAEAWTEVLRDLRDRGMCAPRAAVADGGGGFWKAVAKVWPETKGQRCWVHKVRNIQCHFPPSKQAQVREELREVWQAGTWAEAEAAAHDFIGKYREGPHRKAAESLERDLDGLLTYYSFPKVHWESLRTTNPIESSFATIRHRTRQTRNCISRKTGLAMVFKIAQKAEARWRRMRGFKQLAKVHAYVPFKDGELVEQEGESCAA